MLRNVAKDVTDADAYRVLRREIPRFYNETFVREQERGSDFFNVVEVRNLPFGGCPPSERNFGECVGGSHVKFVSVVFLGTHFEVTVGSAREKNLLLSLNGSNLSNGQKLQVFPKEFQLPPTEIIGMMHKWLTPRSKPFNLNGLVPPGTESNPSMDEGDINFHRNGNENFSQNS